MTPPPKIIQKDLSITWNRKKLCSRDFRKECKPCLECRWDHDLVGYGFPLCVENEFCSVANSVFFTVCLDPLIWIHHKGLGSKETPAQDPGDPAIYIKESGIRGKKRARHMSLVLYYRELKALSVLSQLWADLPFGPAMVRFFTYTCNSHWAEIVTEDFCSCWDCLSIFIGRTITDHLLMSDMQGMTTRNVPSQADETRVQPSVEHLLGLIKLKPVEGRRVETFFFNEHQSHYWSFYFFFSLCVWDPWTMLAAGFSHNKNHVN